MPTLTGLVVHYM